MTRVAIIGGGRIVCITTVQSEVHIPIREIPSLVFKLYDLLIPTTDEPDYDPRKHLDERSDFIEVDRSRSDVTPVEAPGTRIAKRRERDPRTR